MTAVKLERVDDDAYQAILDDAIIAIDKVHDSSRDGLVGSLKVHWTGKPQPRLILPSSRVSFERPTWQRTIVPVLRDAEKHPDWQQILTDAFAQLEEIHRTGPALMAVDTLADPAPKFLIRPTISASGSTVIAAMGGTGKGWYAIATSLTVATGRTRFLGLKPIETLPVIYLDWEDDRDYFAERVHAMCRPHKIDVPGPDMLMHATCDQPLGSMVDGLVRSLHRRGIHRAFFVIDSRGAAAGSDVNEAAGTNALYDALRKIPGPSLVVDHQSWEASRKKRDGAIGSVYGWNRPRMIWNAESVPTANGLTLVIRNPKFNRGPKQPNQAWDIHIDSTSDGTLRGATLRPISPQTVIGLPGEDASLADQIWSTLAASDEPLTIPELETMIGRDASTIRTVLNRHKARFENVSTDRTGRWTVTGRDPRDHLPDPFEARK